MIREAQLKRLRTLIACTEANDHFESGSCLRSSQCPIYPDISLDEFSKKVRPPLHHLPAIDHVFSLIVASANLIALSVRQLTLDNVRPESHFIEDRRRRRPEAMGREPDAIRAIEAHSLQSAIEGGRGHALAWLSVVGEQQPATSRVSVKLPQQSHCLIGQGDDVLLPHLHPLCGDAPFRGIEIELFPSCHPKLDRSNEREQHQA